MSSDKAIQLESIEETESTEESQEAAASPLLEESQKSQDSADLESSTPPRSNETGEEEVGRERLKRHRVDVAGRVWIPDMWGQEDLLNDWIDCTAFDASLARTAILMARDSLIKDARTPHSTHLRVHDA